MAGSRVVVEGLDDLELRFGRLTNAMSGELLSDATEAAAEEFMDFLVATAPRASGQLADSVRTEKQSSGGFTAAWRVGASKQGFHGMFQERGTIHMAAQPWIRPAFDAGKLTATHIAQRLLRANIGRSLRG